MNPEDILNAPQVRAAIDAAVAESGRPRAAFERYMTAPPPTGLTEEGAVQARLDSLHAPAPPQQVIEELQAMTASVLPAQDPAA